MKSRPFRIGIVARSAEGAVRCRKTICVEVAQSMPSLADHMAC
jgi:hypothetical protein